METLLNLWNKNGCKPFKAKLGISSKYNKFEIGTKIQVIDCNDTYFNSVVFNDKTEEKCLIKVNEKVWIQIYD